MEVCYPSWATKTDFEDMNKFNLIDNIDWD